SRRARGGGVRVERAFKGLQVAYAHSARPDELSPDRRLDLRQDQSLHGRHRSRAGVLRRGGASPARRLGVWTRPMKHAEFSVVLPPRDRAAVVTRAITSVRAQTWSDWELIVVDDGSRDDTLERIRAFTDRRIRLLCLTDPGGSSRARNEGIGASRG